MSRSPLPSPTTTVNVRNIISIFENQSTSVKNEPAVLLKRTKSLGSLSKRPVTNKRTQIVSDNNSELTQIDQEIQHLQNNLSKYKIYSKESHIHYQNQIFFLLTDIINVDAGNKTTVINKKSELIDAIKRLNKDLNSRLPSENRQNTNERKVENIVVRSIDKQKSIDKQNSIEKQNSVEKEEKPRPSEIEDEADTPALSVKKLKELFEKKSENEGVTKETATVKISRKFVSFNGSSSDIKYVPFNERFKTTERYSFDSDSLDTDQKVVHNVSIVTNREITTSTSIDQDSGEENHEEIKYESDENLSPDSLSSDDDGSDNEKNEDSP